MSSVRETSSGSNASARDDRYTGMDERKRKRMISNRDSARRSRMRKQKVLEDLNDEVARIQCENNRILLRMGEATEGYKAVAAENNVLRAQAAELADRFRSLVGFLKGVGLKLDGPDMPDQLLEPWHLSCPPPTASAGFLAES